MQRYSRGMAMKKPTRQWLRTETITACLYGKRYWQRQRGPHLRSPWCKRVMVSLLMCGALVVFGTVVVKHVTHAMQLGEQSPSVSQVVQHTQVVIVKDAALPPVLQRIAQCESKGQHFTKEGKVVRGKRNPHDTGLFQINAAVWGKKAQELGYDIHAQEGNEQMARYLFENYGSVPWQTSSRCWNRQG